MFSDGTEGSQLKARDNVTMRKSVKVSAPIISFLDNKWWMRLYLSHPPEADDYSSSAPSEGSSAASTFESRFMLVAWTSVIRCLNLVPSTSSSTSRLRRVPSKVTS